MALVQASTLAFGALLLLFAAAPTVTAADIDTNVGCGGDTVEVCFPVCVTYPCYGYACVHTQQVEKCRTLGP